MHDFFTNPTAIISGLTALTVGLVALFTAIHNMVKHIGELPARFRYVVVGLAPGVRYRPPDGIKIVETSSFKTAVKTCTHSPILIKNLPLKYAQKVDFYVCDVDTILPNRIWCEHKEEIDAVWDNQYRK